MRLRGSISTSAIHFTISKTVSTVRADATEVPLPKKKSSSTNGLAATGPQRGSKFKKKISEYNFPHDQKNTLNPLVKSIFKSVHSHGRYLQFCIPSRQRYFTVEFLFIEFQPTKTKCSVRQIQGFWFGCDISRCIKQSLWIHFVEQSLSSLLDVKLRRVYIFFFHES